MSDVLSLLRKAIINHSNIEYADGFYIFDSYKLPESTKTCFRRSLRAGADYYTLKDVIFFFENFDSLGDIEYRKKALQARVTSIVELDRKNLKDYLTGVVSSCQQLDLQAAIPYVVTTTSTTSTTITSQDNRVESSSSSSSSFTTTVTAGINVPVQEISTKISSNSDKSRHSSSASIMSGGSVSSSADNNNNNNNNNNMESISETIIQSSKNDLSFGKRKVSMIDVPNLDSYDPEFLEKDRKFMSRIRSQMKPVQTRYSVLDIPGADFSFVLKIFNDHVLKPAEVKEDNSSQSGQEKKSSESSTKSSIVKSPGSKTITSTTPIIIVPMALTSCLTTMNAAEFLEKGIFIPVDEKMKLGGTREQEINIYRSFPGHDKRQVKYKVIDNHRLLRPEDWDRVVAVFALGQPWQFKDWKWSDPVELFRHVLGIHLTMDDRAVDNIIQSWNCKILKVYRFKRHMDAEAVNEFWALLDDFMKLKKPALWNAIQNSSR